jgi:hypothetical protein
LRVLESDDALRADVIRQFMAWRLTWWKPFRIEADELLRFRFIEELRETLLPKDREDS